MSTSLDSKQQDRNMTDRTYFLALTIDSMTGDHMLRECSIFGVDRALADGGYGDLVDVEYDVPAEDSEYGYLHLENGCECNGENDEDGDPVDSCTAPDDSMRRWDILSFFGEVDGDTLREVVWQAGGYVRDERDLGATMGVLSADGVAPAVSVGCSAQDGIASIYITPAATHAESLCLAMTGGRRGLGPVDDEHGIPVRMLTDLAAALRQ